MIEVTMHLAKLTKGAVVYQEQDHNKDKIPMHEAKIGTLYIRKTAFSSLVTSISSKNYPSSISITIDHD